MKPKKTEFRYHSAVARAVERDVNPCEGEHRGAADSGDCNAQSELDTGVRLSRKGLWRYALPHLRRSIELAGDRAAAYLYLGEALNSVDDLSGALSALSRAHELDPDSERVLRGLGVVYDRLGRPKEAVKMYHRSRDVAERA